MKKTVFTIAFALIGLIGFAQQAKVTKYVTTFPNGEEAITIVDNSAATNLKLESAESFYKYEILSPEDHELIHESNNRGKVCEIDKTKLKDGTYTLKVYTKDFVITSDITIEKGAQTGIRTEKTKA